MRRLIPLLIIVLFAYGIKNVSAETMQSIQYVPLIGISSVPDPLALPQGKGEVTYHYAVKNFLQELPLTDVRVSDDGCDAVRFVEGDDNGDARLDYQETWRYACTTNVATTTRSTATATGTANNLTATHHAYMTIVVGLKDPAPLVSIVNITKIAYPLALPIEGGAITFTYKVNNPGVVPLSDVVVTDDKCSAISGKLGDTNGNNLLDTREVWIYTCTAILKQTTTNTATVTAFANGLKAVGEAVLTVKVDNPDFPDVGTIPDGEIRGNRKIIVWAILVGILVFLIALSFMKRMRTPLKKNE